MPKKEPDNPDKLSRKQLAKKAVTLHDSMLAQQDRIADLEDQCAHLRSWLHDILTVLMDDNMTYGERKDKLRKYRIEIDDSRVKHLDVLEIPAWKTSHE